MPTLREASSKCPPQGPLYFCVPLVGIPRAVITELLGRVRQGEDCAKLMKNHHLRKNRKCIEFGFFFTQDMTDHL